MTHQEYLANLKASGEREIPTSWELGRYPHERSNHPVYTVRAEAAGRYAAWLRDQTGRSFRLPSEAEWEYAAAGARRAELPWGDDFAPWRANTIELGLLTSTPVGIFPEGDSPFGVADMAGNVEELVADDYAPYPGARPIEDDLLAARGRYRVARGGSFTFARAVFPWWGPEDGLPFDAVLDSGCLHHQHPDDHGAYLRRVVQLMRPGALFALSVFATRDRIAERGHTSEIDGGRLCRKYAEPELRRELEQVGLSWVTVERVSRSMFDGCYLVAVAKRG